MKQLTILILAALALQPLGASAFCGFFVAQADTQLFNQASKVVLVRDGNRTVLTMVNDYQGDAKEFALVVPVPTFLEEEQIHVTKGSIVDHLDAYTAPRLVEYHDEDPCAPDILESPTFDSFAAEFDDEAPAKAEDLGVTIEAEYHVGEYDILILSAEESDGLEKWLHMHNYKIPEGASKVLASYIKQKMRFFVAKVNIEEKERLGNDFLRPLQVAYESPKFMLPVRLGTINADGPQELFAFVITRSGRVETTNYRTVKLPTGMDLPVFIKDDFGTFYKDMFEYQVKKDKMRVVYQEYAWDMNWCDPCAADPLSAEQLRELGCYWIDGNAQRGPAREAFVTRLHCRYTAETFPEDIQFQVTSDKTNFQGRYVLRHVWKGAVDCKAGKQYVKSLPARFDQEAKNLHNLTGWNLADIRKRMNIATPAQTSGGESWWKRIWTK